MKNAFSFYRKSSHDNQVFVLSSFPFFSLSTNAKFLGWVHWYSKNIKNYYNQKIFSEYFEIVFEIF